MNKNNLATNGNYKVIIIILIAMIPIKIIKTRKNNSKQTCHGDDFKLFSSNELDNNNTTKYYYSVP